MIKKWFLGFLRFFMCHVLYRVKYINSENLENLDKCVVCSNHSHAFDAFWIYLNTNNMWIMAKAELFKNKIIAKIYRAYNVFPIKRGQKDAASLKHAINVLEKNDKAKLLIFPEGTRIHKDKERGKAKVGAAYIASKANVPIIPVHITKNPRLFSKIYVVYGNKIDITNDISENKEELYKLSDKVLDDIYKLK